MRSDFSLNTANIGAPVTHTTPHMATHAPITPESMVDTTGDNQNVQPLQPGAPGSRVVQVKMIGCVMHVLHFSIMAQNLG